MRRWKAMGSNLEKNQSDKEPKIELDRVIHEPARLLIVTHLYVLDSADFLFLLSQTGLTKGNLSSHLSKLETAGYVEIHKEFIEKIPHTMLTLTNAGREALMQYRSYMQEMLNKLPS